MIAVALRKEWRAIVRDGRFVVLALALGLLLAGVLAVTARQHRLLADEKAQVAAAARQQWDTQGDKHPHRGAHFGHYVFRPESALAGVDPGLDAYVGQALWLEPHRRNMTRFRPAADELPSVRWGGFTPAFVLIALLPLLIIAFGFNAVSQERESGTLRMLHGAGVDARTLLWAKFAALLSVFGAAVPLAMAAGLGLAPTGTGPDAATVARAAVLALAGVAYCACLAALVLWVSARASRSRQALLVLLGLWVAFVFVVPRMGAAVAQRVVPLPSPEAFWRDIQRDYAQGLDGDGDLATRGRRVDAELLQRYGVSRVEDLPVGAAPLRRLARDAYADRVHGLHFGELWSRYQQQENVLRLAAVLSPAVAMRGLSMKMAGTDLAHQRHFEEAAENYRRQVNTAIDRWDADNTRGLTSFESRYGGDALWRSVPPFVHAPPGIGFALRSAWVELAVLAAWVTASLALLLGSARRLSP